ncbi:hypothetical protein [Lacrimispora amygdalina]|uniref:hypothetical protein n=1 Tax=Lacrimispora amygdalina TaxID=253257 RepID=UPI000BE2495C|nr:hypothetical protein [Lacrimispora amygdalina]
MNLIYGILIGILCWQAVVTILLLIDGYNETFQIISCGLPLWILKALWYPFDKYHMVNRHRYYRCKKRIGDTTEKTWYYCTKYDYRDVKISDLKNFHKNWFVANSRLISKRDIKRSGIKYWKNYIPE